MSMEDTILSTFTGHFGCFLYQVPFLQAIGSLFFFLNTVSDNKPFSSSQADPYPGQNIKRLFKIDLLENYEKVL